MPTRKLVVRYEQDLALFPNRIRSAFGSLPYCCSRFPFWFRVLAVYWSRHHGGDRGAVAMMILTGFGQVSLEHAAFIRVGAYSVAILGSIYGLPFAQHSLAGVVAAWWIDRGPFALRRGLYLAIVTVGLLFLVQHSIKQGIEPL